MVENNLDTIVLSQEVITEVKMSVFPTTHSGAGFLNSICCPG